MRGSSSTTSTCICIDPMLEIGAPHERCFSDILQIPMICLCVKRYEGMLTRKVLEILCTIVIGGMPVYSQNPPPGAVKLDLAGALQRARDYNQQFLTAGIAAALAREDRLQA